LAYDLCEGRKRVKNGNSETDFFIFANTFIHDSGMSGGAMRLFKIIAKLNEKKYQITMVVPKIGVTFCKNNGVKAKYHITSNISDKYGIIAPYIWTTLKSCFSTPKISCKKNIVYSQSDFLPDVLPAFVCKLKNRKKQKLKWVQLIFHIIPSNRFISHYAQQCSFFFIKRFADLVIVDNNLLKKDLARQGFDIRKIKFNPPGTEIEYFRSITNTEEKRYDAVFLGRIHTSKGIFDLVNIWKYVYEIKPNAKLAIIGRGKDERIKKELERKIRDAHLEHNVEIMGYLENNEAFGIVKSSKVFVFPSHEEGFGISILEAMCCGVPVVAWNLPVYSEIFHNGLIQVEENEFRKFSDAVICLLSDESRYIEIKKDALELSARHSWDVTVEAEMDLLKELM